jgi:hypothetical protein
MKHASHGEVNFYKVDVISSKKTKTIFPKGNRYIVAESEVTGNHHYIDACKGIELFEDDAGILWMENSVNASVKCVIEQRHTTIELEPGIWLIQPSMEYDYISEEVRACKD